MFFHFDKFRIYFNYFTILLYLHKNLHHIYLKQVLRDNPKARREVELHYLACDHPNIVKIIDVFENQFCNQKCILLIMECMDGGELFQAIQKRAELAFTEREAAQIISKLQKIIKLIFNFKYSKKLIIFFFR